MLMVSFIYTACFMLVLLVVAFVKLVIMPHKRPRFLDVMTHEGLQYYIIALVSFSRPLLCAN